MRLTHHSSALLLFPLGPQHGLRPYIKDAQKILSKAHETGNPKITQQKIDFLHLPIIDGNVTTDSAMNR